MLAYNKIVGVVDSTFLEACAVICVMQFELRRNFSGIVALSQYQRRIETQRGRVYANLVGGLLGAVAPVVPG